MVIDKKREGTINFSPGKGGNANAIDYDDPDGDSANYSGPLNERGLPHGRGKLVYDDLCVFEGIFQNGAMFRGVLYTRRGLPKSCMTGGEWLPGLNQELCEQYAFHF